MTDESKRGRPSKLAPDDLTLVRQMREEGVTMAKICARFNVTEQTVRNHLKRAGIPMHSGPLAPEETRERALVLHEQGMSLHKISAELGFSPSSIRGWLQAKGRSTSSRSDRNPPFKLAPIDMDVVRRLHGEGKTLNQISLHLGVQPITLRKRLDREGVTLKRRTGRWSNKTRARAFALREQGMTAPQISAETGCPLYTLNGWFRATPKAKPAPKVEAKVESEAKVEPEAPLSLDAARAMLDEQQRRAEEERKQISDRMKVDSERLMGLQEVLMQISRLRKSLDAIPKLRESLDAILAFPTQE